MAVEMEPGRCHVCLVEDQKVTAFQYMPELLLKHLGVLVYDKVLACEACNKLLNLWDEFLDESRLNMQESHPNALHKYKQKMLGHAFSKSTVENGSLKPDPGETSFSAALPPIPGLKTEDTASESMPIKEEVTTQQEVIDCSELFVNKQVLPEHAKIPEAVETSEAMQINIEPHSPTIKADVSESELQEWPVETQGNYQVRPDGSVSPPYVPPSDEDQLQECPPMTAPLTPLTPCENTNTPKFTCERCKREFTHEILLKIHVDMNSCKPPCSKDKEKIYHLCPRCGVNFPQPQSLLTHILESHSEQKNSKFICVYCRVLSHDRNSLKSHLRTHFGITFHFKCKFCKKVLSSKQKLNNHIQIEHEDKDYQPKTSIWKDVDLNPRTRFPCHICHKILSTKTSLKNHTKRLHSSITHSQTNSTKKYLCEVCGNSFTKQQGLSSHMKHHNNQELVPEYHQQVSNQSNDCQPPQVKLTIFKDSGTFACKIGERDIFNDENPTVNYTVDSIEIPVPDIDLHIHESSSNNSDSNSQTPQVQSFCCYFCNKTFFSKLAITYHMSRSHIKEKHHLRHAAYDDNYQNFLVASTRDKNDNNTSTVENLQILNVPISKPTSETGNKGRDVNIEIIDLD